MASLRNEHVDAVMDSWESGPQAPLWISTWNGVLAAKNPCDSWIYQEMIFELKPDVIIETGSFKGGSGLMFANLQDLIGNGEVISVDTTAYPKPKHPRISWLKGYSTQADVQDLIKEKCKGKTVWLNLDSDHEGPNVYAELEAYASLATKYIVVEDTWWNPDTKGPWPAVQKWLEEHPEWKIDKSKERYSFTNNPNGFLTRV